MDAFEISEMIHEQRSPRTISEATADRLTQGDKETQKPRLISLTEKQSEVVEKCFQQLTRTAMNIREREHLRPDQTQSVASAFSILTGPERRDDYRIQQIFLTNILHEFGSGVGFLCAATLKRSNIV
ncbi:hypothetical protein MMC28_004551 [Mycoblastus sanguinarius]|nr:hypothetical protein [Mycoblastus sanguinarius]